LVQRFIALSNAFAQFWMRGDLLMEQCQCLGHVDWLVQ